MDEDEERYEPEELDDAFFENLLSGGREGKGDRVRKVKVNFDGAQRHYANFCTLTARSGEVFLSFGQAFPPVREANIATQVVMSAKNAAQLHRALEKMLERLGELPEQ